MLLDAFTGKGLQVDSNRTRSRRSLPIYFPKQKTKNVPSSTMQKDGGLVLRLRSPPFFGSWDQMNNPMLGYGEVKKSQKKNHKKRQKEF